MAARSWHRVFCIWQSLSRYLQYRGDHDLARLCGAEVAIKQMMATVDVRVDYLSLAGTG